MNYAHLLVNKNKNYNSYTDAKEVVIVLISDKIAIGLNLRKYRKLCNLTQIEVAEKANLSDRTYADIERGYVNMRVDTLLKICKVLNTTPNNILVQENNNEDIDNAFSELSNTLSLHDKQQLLKINEILKNRE